MKSIKIVFMGASNAGKTSIIQKLVHSTFERNEATVGVSLEQMVLDQFQIQIWDTAGQEKYADLAPMYYRNADLIFIVFEVLDRQSFTKAKQLVADLKFDSTAKLVVLANKCDQEQRSVMTMEIDGYSAQNDLKIYEVSAITTSQQRFREIVIESIDPKKAIVLPISKTIRWDEGQEKTKKSCC